MHDVGIERKDTAMTTGSKLTTKGLVALLGALSLACSDDTPTDTGSPPTFDDLVTAPLSIQAPDRAPLSREATFETTEAVSVRVEILDDGSVSHTFEDLRQEHRIPILGLRAGASNLVEIRLTTADGEEASDTLTLETDPLPDLFPSIEIPTAQPDRMEPGWTLASFSIGDGGEGHFLSYPFMIDEDGEIRWFLDLSHFGGIVYMVEAFDNGNLIFGHGSSVYEYDRLGREVDRWDFPGFLFHHDVVERENGNLIVAVNEAGGETVEDHVIEVDRETGDVVAVWDFRDFLDPERNHFVDDQRDWFHMNSVWYDEGDDALIASGRNQSAVVKVTRDGEVVWILGPHRGWGEEFTPFLLTAVDSNGDPLPEDVQEGSAGTADFDWGWGQHTAALLPNGNLILFDNGFRRHFEPVAPGSGFSRAVEYEIDEEEMTIRQVWEYGRERGSEYQSTIISDVDHLAETGHRLVTPGITADRRAFVTEVALPDNEVIFEAVFEFENLLGSGELRWGDFDMMYRSERLPLYR